jgi:hypothetical protein
MDTFGGTNSQFANSTTTRRSQAQSRTFPVPRAGISRPRARPHVSQPHAAPRSLLHESSAPLRLRHLIIRLLITASGAFVSEYSPCMHTHAAARQTGVAIL